MNEPTSSSPSQDLPGDFSPEERNTALFANMVIQQTNMALLFLGKVPHPETGQLIQDMDAAQMFIDQLEMLEAKTKGNLDKREEGLLKQSLMTLRMAFVETIEKGDAKGAPKTEAAPAQAGDAATAAGAEEKKVAGEPAGAPDDAESRKKFSKKY